MTLQGYIIPDTIQKDLASIKKFSDKSKIIFDVEVVDNLSVLDGIVDSDIIDATQDSDDLELNSPSTNLQTP